MYRMKFFGFFLILIGLIACNNQSNESLDNNLSVTSPYELGEKIYASNCIACHQKDGVGVEGAFPPLAGSDYLLADKKRAIGIAANGMSGEIRVNGVSYNSVMTDQGLSNEEVRDVVNYILNSWGNNGGEVTLDDVVSALK